MYKIITREGLLKSTSSASSYGTSKSRTHKSHSTKLKSAKSVQSYIFFIINRMRSEHIEQNQKPEEK